MLEPGGRIAVNVANLGRKPYRSLAADVIHILQDRLGLLLRGEIVWQKGAGASGLVRVGLVPEPVEPGAARRHRAGDRGEQGPLPACAHRRRSGVERGLPHESTIATEDFMALTLDVWQTPSESARRVGHPAPFPVELPEKLIELYTFVDDLVLDPFMGSGSTLVAASRLGRRYVGYDLDPGLRRTRSRRGSTRRANRYESTPERQAGSKERIARGARSAPASSTPRARASGSRAAGSSCTTWRPTRPGAAG